MVINGRWDGRAVTLSAKPNCLTVSLQAGKDSMVASYDLTGLAPDTAYSVGVVAVDVAGNRACWVV